MLCIRDVGSTFGTYLNDKRLSEPKRASEPHKLKAYDSIKVGQTSLRWRPIELIGAAVAVGVSKAFPYGEWLEHMEDVAFMDAEHVDALGAVLAAYEKQRKLVHAELCKAIMPVELPLLFRRAEQVRHVQVQTLLHAISLPAQPRSMHSPAYRPGERPLRRRAVTTESASANEAAVAAKRAAGWQEDDHGLARLRELLGEARWMREECFKSEQTDQNNRLSALLDVQLHHAAMLHAHASWCLATPLRQARHRAQKVAELTNWVAEAISSSSLALELSLLCECWLRHTPRRLVRPNGPRSSFPNSSRRDGSSGGASRGFASCSRRLDSSSSSSGGSSSSSSSSSRVRGTRPPPAAVIRAARRGGRASSRSERRATARRMRASRALTSTTRTTRRRTRLTRRRNERRAAWRCERGASVRR